MGTRDHAQYGTPSCPWIGDPPNGPDNIPNINDGNDNSYGMIAQVWNQDTRVTIAEWTVTLGGYYLTKLKYIYSVQISQYLPFSAAGAEFWLDYYNGSWHNLYHEPEFRSDIPKTTKQYTAGYANVTKARIKIALWAGGSGEGPGAATSHCFTIGMEGYYFPDSGLRIKTASGIKEVGKETTLTGHKLRMHDGSSIIALPLLATSHVRAIDGLRIYDGSAVKCLAEATY